jgi:putative holliday junction resolvase
MKSLGIDFGTKKVGLAMSDNDGIMAFPFKIIKNDENLIKNILDIINENNNIQKDIEKFLEKLKGEINIPIKTVIESFTSSHSRTSSDKSSLNDRKTKQINDGLVDAKAATLILQRGLETIKNL